jgi:UDP-N-acetylglucosamine 2-epimerase (non-hydrolysing)
MTIIGTRPEIIRLSEIFRKSDKYFDHILVHTGQNYDFALSEIFFNDLNLREPNYFLNCKGNNLGEVLGNIISKSYDILVKEKPDALLILGDTNSSLAAIPAKRLKIPIFHMEAGNRCWDWNVPEMINRKIVDHISDINIAYTENSRRYLLSEGIDGKTIFVSGSPMMEVLNANFDKIESSKILKDLNLEKNKYFLVSAHREENIDNEMNFNSLMDAINNVAEKYELPIIYSAHPRSLKLIEKRAFKFSPLVRIHEPFSFSDYIKLQIDSKCVLSDSGTLSEESAMLNFPAVLIRTSTERPEAVDSGTIIVGGIKSESIIQSIDIVTNPSVCKQKNPVENYANIDVSNSIIRLIQSYTNIINMTTWRK